MLPIPTVSVIIPNYNHYIYLIQRIESILNQSYHDYEVIIMDDCSTDNSAEIIEKYRNHPKVANIIYNTANSGSTFHQWNKGVDVAKGKYIWIAESDDIAEYTFLQKLVPELEKDPDTAIAYCQSSRINAIGEVFGDWHFQTDDLDKELFRNDFTMQGHDYINRFLIYKNTIPNASALVFSKHAYLKAGGADPNIKFCSDWLTWLKMLNFGNIYYTSQKLNSFRYHESSVIASSKSMLTFWKKYDIILRLAYKAFLVQLKPSSILLFKKNLKLLRKDSRKEFKFLCRNKQYTKSLYYLKLAALTG